jgi:DNA-binding LacI/PurR family transcriptional regulator
MIRIRRGVATRGLLPLAILHGFPMRLPIATNAVFRDFWNRASERARQLGYRLEEFWMREPGVTPARLRSILLARGIRGLLLSQPVLESDGRLAFDLAGFCAVNSGACDFTPQIHSVVSHHTQMTRLALDTVLSRGYRRIGLAFHPARRRTFLSDDWAEYLAYCASGLIPEPLEAFPTAHTSGAAPRFLEWCRRERPEVIIGNPDALHWLRDAGIRVPADIAFVALGREVRDVDSAGVDNRNQDQAAALVDLLVAHLQRSEFGPPPFAKTVMIQGRWVDGSTLPQRRRSTRRRTSLNA